MFTIKNSIFSLIFLIYFLNIGNCYLTNILLNGLNLIPNLTGLLL